MVVPNDALKCKHVLGVKKAKANSAQDIPKQAGKNEEGETSSASDNSTSTNKEGGVDGKRERKEKWGILSVKEEGPEHRVQEGELMSRIMNKTF